MKRKKVAPSCLVSFAGLGLSRGNETRRKEHVSAGVHFSDGSGKPPSAPNPGFCWEPQERRLSWLSKRPGLLQASTSLGPPTTQTCARKPFSPLQEGGKGSCWLEVTMVTSDRRKSLHSILQPGRPAPGPSPLGSSWAAGRACPPAASGACFSDRFPSGSTTSQKQGFKLRRMGTKSSPEENSQAFPMSGTTQEPVKTMGLESAQPGQIPQFSSSLSQGPVAPASVQSFCCPADIFVLF